MSCKSRIAISISISLKVQLRSKVIFDIHAILVLLQIEDFLQFYLRFNIELDQQSLSERIDRRYFLIHRKVKSRSSSTQYQNFIILQWRKAIAHLSLDNLSIVKGGMRYFSQLGEEAVELGDLELVEIGKSWLTHFVSNLKFKFILNHAAISPHPKLKKAGNLRWSFYRLFLE